MTPQMPASSPENSALDEANLDGHTVEELSDYLDAGRNPTNFSIESSPGCQIALDALVRLRELTLELLEAEARTEPAPDDSWVHGIMNRIALEAHAGRKIPIAHENPRADLSLTEGAVRGLFRRAGDSVGGVIVGRCELDGDVSVPREPVSVRMDISVAWGEDMQSAADRVRAAVMLEVARHTELNVTRVDITVRDVRVVAPPAAAGSTPEPNVGES